MRKICKFFIQSSPAKTNLFNLNALQRQNGGTLYKNHTKTQQAAAKCGSLQQVHFEEILISLNRSTGVAQSYTIPNFLSMVELHH